VLLLVDLDGVVYRGSTPVPGMAAVLAQRAEAGDDVVYVTNNSMHYRAEYVARLGALGAPVHPDRVVTSARATALHFQLEDSDVRRVLVVGASGLEREMRDVGLEVVTAAHAATRMAQEGIDGRTAAANPDAVVCGLDPQLTYLRLAAAADCIRGGSAFVATNADPVFPTERGLRPGAGSIVAALQRTTGVEPLTIGKPGPKLFELAAATVGRTAGDAVVIGDNLATDIAGAHVVGARSVLVMTGVTTPTQLDSLPDDRRPTAVAQDADGLRGVLERLAEAAHSARGDAADQDSSGTVAAHASS
jgi:HAD superfamily hydrolase (TIGR01450 family)